MTRLASLVLLAVTVLWGSTFIVTKDVVRAAPPCGYAALRFLVATLALLPLLLRRKFDRRALYDGLILGLLNALALFFQVVGQVYTTASKSSFITSLNTPLTPVMALFFYGLRPTRAQLAAVTLATAGLCLLTWPSVNGPLAFGDVFTLGCATLYALYIVEAARRMREHDTVVMSFLQVGATTAVFTALHLALRGIPHGWISGATQISALEARPLLSSSKVFVEILYMGLVCGALATLGQSWALRRMEATTAALIFALEPVFATLIALGVDGRAEWPGRRGAEGALLVLTAVIVASWKRSDGPGMESLRTELVDPIDLP